MTDSFIQLTIIYKNTKPDLGFYRGQMIVFSKQRIRTDKCAYVASTDDGYMVVHGAPNCVAVIHDKNVSKWIETERVVGKDDSSMVHYEKA